MAHVLPLVARTAMKIRQIGPWRTAKQIPRYLLRQYREYLWRMEEDCFDRAHGTKTRYHPDEDVPCSAYKSEGNQGYDPTRVSTFRNALRSLRIEHREFIFVDIGSGKGRAVLLAARYPFRKIVGIEVDPRLHEAAHRNISARSHPERRCFDIELLCGDALTVDLEATKVVFHLFNPFGRPGMQRFLGRVETALTGPLSEVYLIYENPLHSDLIERCGFLNLVSEVRGYDEYTHFSIYSNLESHDSSAGVPAWRRTVTSGVESAVAAWRRVTGFRGVAVGRTSGKGVGVFATRSFAAGEFVMPIRGRPVRNRTEYSIQIGFGSHIEPRSPERLINHSCDPNLGIRIDGRGGRAFFARRFIQSGEEITWDYAMAEWDFRIDGIEETFDCKCGTARCRGQVEGGWNGLPRELQREYEDWCMPYLRRADRLDISGPRH